MISTYQYRILKTSTSAKMLNIRNLNKKRKKKKQESVAYIYLLTPLKKTIFPLQNFLSKISGNLHNGASCKLMDEEVLMND
jgi:hypothetical protein